MAVHRISRRRAIARAVAALYQRVWSLPRTHCTSLFFPGAAAAWHQVLACTAPEPRQLLRISTDARGARAMAAAAPNLARCGAFQCRHPRIDCRSPATPRRATNPLPVGRTGAPAAEEGSSESRQARGVRSAAAARQTETQHRTAAASRQSHLLLLLHATQRLRRVGHGEVEQLLRARVGHHVRLAARSAARWQRSGASRPQRGVARTRGLPK